MNMYVKTTFLKLSPRKIFISLRNLQIPEKNIRRHLAPKLTQKNYTIPRVIAIEILRIWSLVKNRTRGKRYRLAGSVILKLCGAILLHLTEDDIVHIIYCF